MLTRPRVGNIPTTELVPEGIRMEFDVSVPFANTAKLAVTAVTEPPEEPPGLKRQSYALPVRPPAELMLVSLAAKSGMLVCPRMTAPAALNFATTAASAGAVNSCPGIRYPLQPSFVIRPLMLVLDL